MKYVMGPIAMLMLVGCASEPTQRAAQQGESEDGVICTYEVPTGSSLRERKCTTPEQREDQRRQSSHQTVYEPGPGNAR